MTVPPNSRTRCALGLVLGLALACTPAEAPPSKQERGFNPPPPQATQAEIDAKTKPSLLGPDEAASLAQRRAAALKLLTDGSTAEHLPIDIVDPGQTFDPRLGEHFPAPR